MGQELNVRWLPESRSTLSGEVREDTVRVYEEAGREALKTLRHEFIDFCVSQAIEPYKSVTNALIRIVNEEAYRKKERIVEALLRLTGDLRPNSTPKTLASTH